MSDRLPQSELDSLREGLLTIAVTGTNGKTTTTSMVAAIAQAAGQVPFRVTTLGMWVGAEQTASDGSMDSFVRSVRRAREQGVRTLALEVTSRALAGGFASRWPADIAVFTNLSQDHLDRHGSPEAYLAAKARLFLGPPAPRAAVLHAGDAAAALIAEVMPADVERFTFAPPGVTPNGAIGPVALAATDACAVADGQRVSLSRSPVAAALGGGFELGVLGAFNVDNALAAALACHVGGFPPGAIRTGLARFAGVPGRFQRIADAPLCLVDFAHSPDALDRVLGAARELAERRGGRLACVFGCGGDRDPDKRAPMGDIADRLAHAIWLTTDNPRSEAPADIAAMVRAGAGGRADWHEQPDRARAIEAALAWAGHVDVVVVAGRGAETEQRFADHSVPFDDAAVLRAALAAREARPTRDDGAR